MKKKIMALLLGVSMAAGLLQGCAGSDNAVTAVTQAPAAVEEEEVNVAAPAEEKAEEPKEEKKEETKVKEEAAEKEEVKEEAGPVLKLNTKKNFEYRLDSEGKALVLGHYPEISVESEGYDALSDALTELNKEIADDVSKNMDEYKEYAENDIVERGELPGDNYTYECDCVVTKADEEIVSIIYTYYAFSGGAHPSTWYVSHNFSTKSGEKLNAANVVSDMDSLPKLLEDRIENEYETEDLYFEDDLEVAIKEHYDTAGDYTFTLDHAGITFYFSAYDLAAYAAGAQIVTINYADEPGIVKEEYAKESSEYIEGVMMGCKYKLSDGNVIQLSWYPGFEDEYDYELTATINGKDTVEKIECAGMEPYIIRTGDKYYLYLQELQMNDYVIIDVYSLEGGKLDKVGTVDRGFKSNSPTDTSDFDLVGRTDMLSTNAMYRSYHVGDDGMPVANDEYDTMLPLTSEKLTLKQDIKAEVFVTEDSKESAEVTIPKGTVLYFFRTDNKTFMDMKDEDDRVIRLYPKTDDYPQTIDGKDIEEIFDGVVFAG